MADEQACQGMSPQPIPNFSQDKPAIASVAMLLGSTRTDVAFRSDREKLERANLFRLASEAEPRDSPGRARKGNVHTVASRKVGREHGSRSCWLNDSSWPCGAPYMIEVPSRPGREPRRLLTDFARRSREER